MIKIFWLSCPHLETGSWHCLESSTFSASFPNPYTSIPTKTVYLPVKSSRRSAEEYAIGWQALMSRSLKTLSQTGKEPSLAWSHLVWISPTMSFYNFVWWWKFLKPLGTPLPQNGTFVIWKCFMAWENCFLSWATFQIGPNCHYWIVFRLFWLVNALTPSWWSFQAFKKIFWQKLPDLTEGNFRPCIHLYSVNCRTSYVNILATSFSASHLG